MVFLLIPLFTLICMAIQLIVCAQTERKLLRAIPSIVSLGISAAVILAGYLNHSNLVGWLIPIGFIFLQSALLGIALAFLGVMLRKVRH